jgi:hypothetical protein
MKKFASARQSTFISIIICIAASLLSACGGSSSGTGSVASTSPIYTFIFDAGSSGTRLTLYEVIPGNGGYPIVTNLDAQEFNDNGINDFMNGRGTTTLVTSRGENVLPNGARPKHCTGGKEVVNGQEIVIEGLGQNDVAPCVLEPLLDSMSSVLAAKKLAPSSVKTELFATAGMRTEDMRNGGLWTSKQIADYYATMKAYVNKLGFNVGDFKTINGNSEEGVWTWVNLNDYYFNAFGGNKTVSQTVQLPVGNIEVGGSSMQIAFPINEAASDAANIYTVKINGYQFNVYSKTFLGLGSDDARKYVKAFGYANNTGANDCYAPLANSNNTKENSGIRLYPLNQVISGAYPFPANAGNDAVSWLTVEIDSLLMQGSPAFDMGSCSSKYATIIDQVVSLQRNKDGTLNDGGTATIRALASKLRASTAPFVGIDNFFYPASDLGYMPATGFNPTTFLQRLKTYCSRAVADPFYPNVCPNGVYMDSFLFGSPNGLFAGSTATFAGVLAAKNDAKQTILTWARGYLLLKYAN